MIFLLFLQIPNCVYIYFYGTWFKNRLLQLSETMVLGRPKWHMMFLQYGFYIYLFVPRQNHTYFLLSDTS